MYIYIFSSALKKTQVTNVRLSSFLFICLIICGQLLILIITIHEWKQKQKSH